MSTINGRLEKPEKATQKVGRWTQDLRAGVMSCKTADFVEFRAGATEPKHCATELRAQHRTSEEEEEGEA